MSVPAPRWGRLSAFLAGALAWAYGCLALFLAFGGTFGSPAWLQLAVVAMLGPAISALVVELATRRREPLRKSLGLSFAFNRWWLLAWLLPLPLCFATLGLSLLLPGHAYDASMSGMVERALATAEQHAKVMELARALSVHPLVLLVLPTLVLAPTAGMIGGLGEELGWRGWLYRETSSLGFWRQSALTAAFSAAWHAPLPFVGAYGYGARPFQGALALFAQLALMAPLFTDLRRRSDSAVACALLHSALGGAAFIAVSPVQGGSGFTTGVSSWTFAFVLLVVNIVWFSLGPGSTGVRAAMATGGPSTPLS